MKLFPLTIWWLVGTGVIAGQTRMNDPQRPNLPAAAPVQQNAVPSGAANPNPSAQIATPAASPAPVPASPVDVPPVPPEVAFHDGKITLTAPNSTLASVLSAISAKTGIEFEGADLGAADRLALSIGPATEADVLAAIFDGSRFDYVAIGRPDSPSIVQRVLLTPKNGAAAGQQTRAAQPNSGDNDGEQEAEAAERVEQFQQAQQDRQMQRQQLEQDRTLEMRQRELYLQGQRQQEQQQNPQPNPQVPKKP